MFPEPRRPAPERSDRAQEDSEFSKALDEAESRDETEAAPEAEGRRDSEPAERTPATEQSATPAAPAVPSEPTSLAAISIGAAAVLAASLTVQPAAEAVPDATASAASDATQVPLEQVATPGESSAAGAPAAAAPVAAAGTGLADDAPEGEAGAEERPFAERLEGEAEVETSAWTPPGAEKPATGVAAAPSATAAGRAKGGDEEALAAVKILRAIGPEAQPAEAKSAPAPSAPPPAAPAHPHGGSQLAPAAPTLGFEARLQQASEASAPAQQASAPRQAAAAPAAQVAIHVARAVEDGVRRLEVRLNPAELGRVEVKLDVAHDGRVVAVVAAERQETLDLLQRDARGLERALQDAGIRADSGSLNFTLRQQDRQAWSGSSRPGGGFGRADGVEASAEPRAAAAFRPRAALRALDISV